MKNLVLLSSIIVCTYQQNLPFYWRGKVSTTFNGTMQGRIPIRIRGNVITYISLDLNSTESDPNIEKTQNLSLNTSFVIIPDSQVLPSNEAPTGIPGTFHKVLFTKGMVTNMEVLDEFNYDGNNSVPVHFGTSWYNIDWSQSSNHSNYLLMQSIRNGGVLNMTFKVDFDKLSKEKSKEITKGKKWEIDAYYCYYPNTNAELINGKCVIGYREIISHYLRLWHAGQLQPQPYNGDVRKVTNNLTFVKNYNCGVSDTKELKKKCKDKTLEEIHYVPLVVQYLSPDKVNYRLRVFPAGLGWAVNTTFGNNRSKDVHDLNFTIIFKNWTFDLPESLLESYRDYSFIYEKLTLEIHYWLKEPDPDRVRKLHSASWLVFGVLTLPCYVILISFCFLILTRSKKAFMVEIWKYNGKQLGEMEKDEKLRWFEDTCKEARYRQDAYVKKSIQDMDRRGVLEGIEEHNLKIIY